MGNCDHNYLINVNTINDAVRESVDKTTPNAFFYLFKQLRKRDNKSHRLIKLVKEFISKADSLLLILLRQLNI